MTAQTPMTGAGSGGSGGTSATDKAKDTASTAAEQGQHVAGVAAGEAKQVAQEVKHQARDLLGEVKNHAGDQTRTGRDRLVQAIQQFSDELESMADAGGGSGVATEVIRQVSSRTRGLVGAVDGKEPSDVLDDVRRFARRRPGAFLLGAVVAGVVAGRMTRATTSSPDSTTPALPEGISSRPRLDESAGYGTGTGFEPAQPAGTSVPTPVPYGDTGVPATPGAGTGGFAAPTGTPGSTGPGPSAGDPLTDPLRPQGYAP